MPHLHLPARLLGGQPAGHSHRRLPVLPAGLLLLLGFWLGPRAWATDITSCPFTITAPGDYHVAQDLSCASTTKPAIQINANNVTLSLDGHSITGPGGMVFQAVAIDVAGGMNASISNGAISSFGTAVELEDGTLSSSVSGLTVTQCDTGISIDRGATDNTVMGNTCTGLDFGISIGGQDNLISNNSCSNNHTGIAVTDTGGGGNTIEGNTALENSTFDLADIYERCDEDRWTDNCFLTESQPCIGTSTCGVQIMCPPDRTVTTAAGQNSATVDVGTPTTTPAGLPVTGVRDDGIALTDPFLIGKTVIHWTVNASQETTANCAQTITVVRPPALNITCPGNQTVTAPAGQRGATVSAGMATTTSAGATLVGVRSDGQPLTTPYPVGTTTITWMVTADELPPATCTETITVQATPPFPFIVHGPSEADPHIDSITVNRGPLFQEAIIHGHGFADVQGTSYVTLGGHQIPVLGWSDDAIGVLIDPMGFGQGPLALNAAYPVQVVIVANGKKSNTVDFFLTDGPPPINPN